MDTLSYSSSGRKYDRIILKLSGEVLRNPQSGEPICSDTLETICEEVKSVQQLGFRLGLSLVVETSSAVLREQLIKELTERLATPWVC